MATLTVPAKVGLIRRTWNTNRPLALAGFAMAGVFAVALVGLVADPRVITGAPAWLKPAKFAISIAVYSFTLIWLLTFVQGRRRLVAVVSWLTAGALALEMVLIGGAAALGTTSHFNVSTPAHAAVWSTMASAIIATWVANLIVGLLLLRQRMADRAMAWALRLGVLASSVGMGVAFFMTSPTAEQLTAARAGGAMPMVGAHAVGVADGGPGLPIVGWSTVGGDLRVAHFIGLHGLQVLPLVGLLLARFAPRLAERDRVRVVVASGLGYLALVAITTWQALRGQPLLAPDWLTVAALAATVAVVAAIALKAVATKR